MQGSFKYTNTMYIPIFLKLLQLLFCAFDLLSWKISAKGGGGGGEGGSRSFESKFKYEIPKMFSVFTFKT